MKITLATSCFVLAAFVAPIAAHAEYFCNAPQSQADKQACELAKLDRPDVLRLFIHRTRAIYGLYMPNYVTEKDAERWDVARRSEEARSIEAKDDRNQIKSVSR